MLKTAILEILMSK